METLVVVARHRNQFYNREKYRGSAEFGSCTSKGSRDLNCCAFESRMGLLPAPLKAYVSSQSVEPLSPPKTRTPFVNGALNSKSEISKPMKKIVRSSPIQINSNGRKTDSRPSDGISSFDLRSSPRYSSLPVSIARSMVGKKERVRGDSFCSERWAGPTYSNSPPPSCLPMPKFSMKSKRTVSLELPCSETDFSLPTFAKSAPASPTRQMMNGSPSSVLPDDNSATRTLRCILNLDVCDD